jgi:diadenosine tetraphosphate (Ap4A) HIT family hydrolase
MNFILDPLLNQDSLALASWPLCQVLFKNEQQFAWFLLVPQRSQITEIYELSTADQMQLMTEISQLSRIVKDYFNPDKLNIAAIGNKVPQLHIHIVGRFVTDPLWPESIWQHAYQPKAYENEVLKKIETDLGSFKFF